MNEPLRISPDQTVAVPATLIRVVDATSVDLNLYLPLHVTIRRHVVLQGLTMPSNAIDQDRQVRELQERFKWPHHHVIASIVGEDSCGRFIADLSPA